MGNLVGMREMYVQASTFKARCLALLDEVARSRTSVVVTKRGKPVAKLVPLDDVPRTTRGSVTLLAEADAAYHSTGEAWGASAEPVLLDARAAVVAGRVATLVDKGRVRLDRPTAAWVRDLLTGDVELAELTAGMAVAAPARLRRG